MKKRQGVLICVMVLSLIGASSLAVPASEPGSPQSDKVRIAVVNFENNSQWHYWGDNLGWAAADELVTQLFKTGEFSIIERTQLETILAEQDLGASGRVNASTAAEIGRILGVQLMLTGSITKFSIETISGGFRGIGGSYSEAESMLDIRLIDTTTAEILYAEEGTGKIRLGGGYAMGASGGRDFDAGLAQEALRPAVLEVVEKLAAEADRFQGLKPVAPVGQVVGAREGDFYINRGESSGVLVGQQYAVFRVVDEIVDANGNVLDRIVDRVGLLQVTRVMSQSAICTIVEGEAAEGDTIEGVGG
jgi:curli biogenesis system outer membrane secretion channel CsgG